MLPSVVTSPFFKRLPAFAGGAKKQQRPTDLALHNDTAKNCTKSSSVPSREQLEQADSLDQGNGVELVFQSPTSRDQGDNGVEVQIPLDALRIGSSVVSSSTKGDESFTSSSSSWRIQGQPSSKQGTIPLGEGDDDRTLNTLETENESITHESVNTMRSWASMNPATRVQNSTVTPHIDETISCDVLQNMLDHNNEMYEVDDASTLSGGSTRASQAPNGESKSKAEAAELTVTQLATVEFEALQAMIFQYENQYEEDAESGDDMAFGGGSGESGKSTHLLDLLESNGSNVEMSFEALQSLLFEYQGSESSASIEQQLCTSAVKTDKSRKATPSEQSQPSWFKEAKRETVCSPEGQPDLDHIEASASNVEVSFAALQNFLLDQEDSSSLVSSEAGESWRNTHTIEMEPAAVVNQMHPDKGEPITSATAVAAEEAPIPDLVQSSSSSVEVSFEALKFCLLDQEDSSSLVSGEKARDREANKSWRYTQTKEMKPAVVWEPIQADKEDPTHEATTAAAEETPMLDLVQSSSSSVEVTVSFEALQNFLLDQEDSSLLLSGDKAGGSEADECWKHTQTKEVEPAAVSEPMQAYTEDPTLEATALAAEEAPILDLVQSSSSSVEVSFETLQNFLLGQEDSSSSLSGDEANHMDTNECGKKASSIGEQEKDFQEAASAHEETKASWKQMSLQIETHTVPDKVNEVVIPSPVHSRGMEKAFHDFQTMLFDAETINLAKTAQEQNQEGTGCDTDHALVQHAEERCSSTTSENEKQIEPQKAGIVEDKSCSAQQEICQVQEEEDSSILDHTASYILASASANNFHALETIHEYPTQDNGDAASEHSDSASLVYVSSCSTKESIECTTLDIQSLIRNASSGSGQLLLSDSEDENDSFQGLQVIVRNGSEDSVEGLQVLSPTPGPVSKVDLEFERFQGACVELKTEDEDTLVEAVSCKVQALQREDISIREPLSPVLVAPHVDRKSMAEHELTVPIISQPAAVSINMDENLFGKQSVPCLVSPTAPQVVSQVVLSQGTPSITLEEKRENEESEASAIIIAGEQANADNCVNEEDDLQSIDFMDLQAMIAQYELGLSSEDEEELTALEDTSSGATQEITLDSTKKLMGGETSFTDSKAVKTKLDQTLDISTVSDKVVSHTAKKEEEVKETTVSGNKFKNIKTFRAFKIFEAPKTPFQATASGCPGKNRQRKESAHHPTTEAVNTAAAKFGVTLRKTNPFGIALRKTKAGDEVNSNVKAVSPRKKPNQLLVRELNHIQTKREDESHVLAASPPNLRSNVQAVSPRKERGQLLVRELKHIQSHGPDMFDSMEGKIQAWQHQEAELQEEIKKKRLSLRKFSSANRKQEGHSDDDSAAPVNGEETLLLWGSNHPTRSKTRRETDLIRELQFVHSKTEGGDITDSLDHKVKSWQREESKRELVEKEPKSSTPLTGNLAGDDKKMKPRGSTNTTSNATLSTRSVTEFGSGSLIASSEEHNTLFGLQPSSAHRTLAIDATLGSLNDEAKMMTSPMSRFSIVVTPSRNTVQKKDAGTVEVTIDSHDNGEWEGCEELVEPFELVVEGAGDDCGYVGHGVSDNMSVCSELTTFTVVSEKPATPTTISPALSTDSTESNETTEVGKSLLQLLLLSRKKLKKLAVRPAFCENPGAARGQESVDGCLEEPAPTPRSRINNCDCILDYDWEELDDRDDIENVCSSPESMPRMKQEQEGTTQPLPVQPRTPGTHGNKKIGQADGFYDSVSISFLADSIGDHVIGQVMEEAMRILRAGGVLNVLDVGGTAIQRIKEHPKYSFLVFSKATAVDQERHETNTLSILEKSGLQNRFDASDPRLVHWTALKQEKPTKVESQAEQLEQLTFLQVPAAALANME